MGKTESRFIRQFLFLVQSYTGGGGGGLLPVSGVGQSDFALDESGPGSGTTGGADLQKACARWFSPVRGFAGDHQNKHSTHSPCFSQRLRVAGRSFTRPSFCDPHYASGHKPQGALVCGGQTSLHRPRGHVMTMLKTDYLDPFFLFSPRTKSRRLAPGMSDSHLLRCVTR